MVAQSQLVACSLFALGSTATASGTAANPIRKVVNMLEHMQEQVKEEGNKETKLHDAFMCNCETQGADLKGSIETGKARIEAITASLTSGSNAAEELKAQLAGHVTSRDEAKKTVATATAMRQKEAGIFAKVKSDTEQNIAALKKAVAALEKGVGGSFIQTSAASLLKTYAMEKADMEDSSRQELVSFLSGAEGEEYAPQSGEILGILKQMGDQMADSLNEATSAEDTASKSFQSLEASKTKEINLLQAQIEEEMMRVGESGVSGAGGQNALDDAKDQLKDDQALLSKLEASCADKTKEHQETEKVLADELVALADTVKILTSDETLELFKKALPASSSFLQVSVSMAATKAKALAVLRGVPGKYLQARPEVDFIALALQGKQQGFEEVLAMIDDMVVTLKQEQADDDTKKSYCEAEFDKSEDTKKALELSISDSETAIDELKGSIAETADEIKALEAGIRKLDRSVAEATDQRQAENANYKELTTNNAMAKEVLLFAKNRLQKFYNPSLATFVQVSRKQDGNGVINMIDLIIQDVDKETQEANVVEKNTQKNFEEMIEASKRKRAEDSTSVTDRAAQKAESEEALQAEANNQYGTRQELMNNGEYIMNLHKSCDWLMNNYAARKEARDAEIDAIGKAKAVLSGADYALVQTSGRRHLRMQR